MKRVHFLVPDLETTRKIVDDLRRAGITERHMHVLAKRGTPLEDLPEASFLQKTDFVPALEQGLAVGGATGALAGLAAIALPTGLVLGGGAVLTLSLMGAGLGAWWSSMIGAGAGNRRVRDYEEALEQGRLLMLVDLPKERVDEIEALVKTHHPEAECEGVEPFLPPPP